MRLRERRVEDGLPVPLQLQVLEADHLDGTRTEELKDGGFVLQGVEFDALGRRRGDVSGRRRLHLRGRPAVAAPPWPPRRGRPCRRPPPFR